MPLPAADAVPVGLAVAGQERSGRRQASRLARVDLGLAREGRARHRLEPRDRSRHRDPARRGGRGRRLLRARRGGARGGGVGAGGPGRAHGVVADVTTPDGRAAVVAGAVEAFGGLDIVVNNVGGSGARTIDEMDVEDLEDVLGRNLFPALAVSRAALPASARARRRRDRADRVDLGSRGRRQPGLQRRQGGRDQPRQGDGARPREGPDPRVQRRARLDALPRRQLGAARAATTPRGWPRSSSASSRGAGSAPSTRSPTSSRSSSRHAPRGSSGRA